ncbi:MAG: PEP-CTERM sorting domain-containing protein [Acidobacteria bacterium]|nr:PEP-CTERM sorting domain-containing protein [Acidobacteriota bacterium]
MKVKYGARGSLTKLILSLVVLGLAGAAQAATVGQWEGSSSFWAGNVTFGTIYSAATLGLNATVESGEAITATNLSNNNFFIMRNPSASLSSAEATALVNWVQSGGILLLFAEQASAVANANGILSSLGSSISVTSSTIGSPYVQASGTLNGADVGASLSGQRMSFYNGMALTGGTAMANAGSPLWNLAGLFRVDNVQLGKVYVFGSPLDANYNSSGFSNTQFFLALLSQSTTPLGFGGGLQDTTQNPEPATFAFAGLALAAVVFTRRRK